MPPPAAEIARFIIEAFAAGDFQGAAQLQLQFALFPGKWMHYGLAPTMKAAMNLIGIPAGDPYPPYAPISGDDLAALAAYLKSTALAPRVAAPAAA
jgi:4-hydroxy-tetrahydrodipicolinate synthase